MVIYWRRIPLKKFLTNITIRKKMIVSHGSIALLAVAVTIIGLLGISMLIGRLEGMYTGSVTSTATVGDVLYYSSDIKGGITGILTQRSNAYFDSFQQMMQGDAQMVATAITTLKSSLEYADSPQAMQLTQELEKLFTAGEATRTQIMSAIKGGDFDLASNLYGMEYRVTLQEIQTTAKELKGIVDESSSVYYSTGLRESNILIALVIVLSLISLALGTTLTHIVTAAVRIPVRQLMDASVEMKNGNLAVADAITYQSKDEIGLLAESMRETLSFLHGYVEEISRTLETVANGDLRMAGNEVTDFRGDFASIKKSLVYILDNLNETLSEISVASQQVNSGASQIAAGSQTLAQGAAEQTSSVEHLSNIIADITSQINVTAAHSMTAMQTMEDTTNQVQACNEQMNHMMAAMNNINQQASQISNIVKTIEDIAFQTNILALNAAVEAARAGAAGKGFAVVADEVRNLAAKSAEASKNTSDLIGATVTAVKDGTKVLTETAQTLTSVVEGSQESAALVSQIAQAAKEEAEAVANISQNIEQITAVVYTTSSTAEESASASQELSGQATSLNGLLDQFRLR